MANKTQNYNLHKIDLKDSPPNITVLNENFDAIDTKLKQLEESGGDITPDSIGALPADTKAVDIGALPLDGSVPMTGNRLEVGNKYGWLFSNANMSQVGICNNAQGASDTDTRFITIRNSRYESDLKNAFAIVSKIAGVEKSYKVYGEHNLDLLKEHVFAEVPASLV